MKNKRIAVGLAVGLVLTLVPVAQAHAGSNLCPSGNVCLYTNAYFSGLLGYRSGGGTLTVSVTANDTMSSWENKGSQWASWTFDAGGAGRCVNMTPKSQASLVNSDENDKLSSWRVWGYC